MPNVVGLEFQAAQAALVSAGVVQPPLINYFSIYPIAAKWVKSALAPNTVTAQSIASGNSVVPNTPLTLTVSQPTMAVVYP